MKRRWALWMALLLCVSVMAGCQKSEAPTAPTTSMEKEQTSDVSGEVTLSNDMDGEKHEITYEKAPERIVTLSGFATEMLLELGLADKIIGYGYMDNEVPAQFKEDFAKLTKLSDGNPSKEDLLKANPDFLVGWYSTASFYGTDFLAENNIKFYVPRVEYAPANMESVYQDFENLGRIFRIEDRAKAIVEDMKARAEAVQKAVSKEEPVSVFIYDGGTDAPFTASAGLPSDMIRIAGGKNVFEGGKENWLTASWEKVLEMNPQYILIMDYFASDPIEEKISFLKTNPALANIEAIKNDRFMTMDLTDVTGCYLSIDAVEKMAKFFHPEAFK